jgi:hypothetical protein
MLNTRELLRNLADGQFRMSVIGLPNSIRASLARLPPEWGFLFVAQLRGAAAWQEDCESRTYAINRLRSDGNFAHVAWRRSHALTLAL